LIAHIVDIMNGPVLYIAPAPVAVAAPPPVNEYQPSGNDYAQSLPAELTEADITATEATNHVGTIDKNVMNNA
jgi:hypothetical protein